MKKLLTTLLIALSLVGLTAGPAAAHNLATPYCGHTTHTTWGHQWKVNWHTTNYWTGYHTHNVTITSWPFGGYYYRGNVTCNH